MAPIFTGFSCGVVNDQCSTPEAVGKFDGRIFGTGGDRMLAEFGGAVEAVRSAISIQEELKVRNAELDGTLYGIDDCQEPTRDESPQCSDSLRGK